MTTPSDAVPTSRTSTDWLGREKTGLPSWLLSALLHGMFLAGWIVLSQTQGCQPGYSGEGGERFRQVGVYLIDGDTDDEPTPSESPAEKVSATESKTVAAEFADSPLLDGPPVELTLPSRMSTPLLGLGAPPGMTTGHLPTPALASSAVTGAPPSMGTARGGATSVFGIADAGRRFVYVFDRSGSMSDYGAIRVAKAELMSSLERLDATQEFQVIFYSSDTMTLTPRSGRSDLFRGIDTHRLEVRRQIEAIPPDGGTRHMPALKAAMKVNPDVIFFLTDGDQSELTTDELKEIKTINNGGARIHTIEFGKGPHLHGSRGPKNFLQKLAGQNDGQYQYRDVTRFR